MRQPGPALNIGAAQAGDVPPGPPGDPAAKDKQDHGDDHQDRDMPERQAVMDHGLHGESVEPRPNAFNCGGRFFPGFLGLFGL
jgi:hypothetical protein